MSAPTAAAAPSPRAGRPRDTALDQAILNSVRELLIERGYQALSVQEVTRRCGVHVRTITRRWSTKPALVAAAILGGDEPLFAGDDRLMQPTGRLDEDVRRLVERSVQYLADPATSAALPALVSELSVDSEVRDRFEQVWCAGLREAGVRHECRLAEGSPVIALLETAARVEADLVVVGRRGAGGFPGLQLGSTSHQLVEHAEVPVMVVPS